MTNLTDTRRILVLNPNSSVAVTEKMRISCAGLSLHPGHETVFATLPTGPAGIESQRDVESVVLPTCDYFLAHPADGYVIGCFSDPGLFLAREELGVPVAGIAESAVLAAVSYGGRFGIIAIKEGSILRHKRMVRTLGVFGCLAGDRALDLGVSALLDEAASIGRIAEVGRLLRDEDGADSLILGCSTMGVYRDRMEALLGIPVIDPTQAAVLRVSALLAGQLEEAP
jgi:allantoin racemase